MCHLEVVHLIIDNEKERKISIKKGREWEF